MSFYIIGLGTANPPHSMSQQEATRLAQDVCGLDGRQRRLSSVLHRRSGVKHRRTIVPHRDALHWVRGETSDGSNRSHRGPTTRERMEMYETYATPLALQAVQEACHQAGLAATEITHLVTVSCTGFFAPGVDVELIRQLKLRPTTQRVHVGYMGCHGAINGLRVAQALVESNPDACVMLCAVECCSLHYRFQWDPDRFIGNALFGDGAAAVVGGAEPITHRRTALAHLSATGSTIIPHSTRAMSWEVGNHGFEMHLSPQAPELIERHLQGWLVEWLAEYNLTPSEVGSWAVHPGGPRILTAVEDALQLGPEQLAASREVLAEHGNMSSPTILFILDRLRQRPAPWPCVSIAFGPGMCAEAALYL